MTKATSIDYAVSGFVRHRFLRALFASIFVLISLMLISMLVNYVPQEINAGRGGGLFLGLPFLAVVSLIWIFGLSTVLGGIVEVLHRRFTALFLAAGWGFLVYYFARELYTPLYWAWIQVEALPAYNISDLTSAASLITLSGFGFLIAYEGLRHALWQLTATHEGFMGARGWRPFLSHMFSFPRQLGVPAHIATFSTGGVRLTLLYYLIAIINTALFGMLLLPFYVSMAGFTLTDPRALGAAAAALVLLLVLGSLIGMVAEKFATRMYQRVREWDARKPVVFLRTFDQDDARLRSRAPDLFAKLPAGVGRAQTLDHILLEHATPYGPVIAIGDPRDPTPPLGAARVFVPERGLGWQDVVKGLVTASKAVVMCPNDTEGVKWELELLGQSIDDLCVIYVANPELKRDTNVKLFTELAAAGASPVIAKRQMPIAMFMHPDKSWRVITARKVCREAYTIALNIALQARFGREGVEMVTPEQMAASVAAT